MKKVIKEWWKKRRLREEEERVRKIKSEYLSDLYNLRKKYTMLAITLGEARMEKLHEFDNECVQFLYELLDELYGEDGKKLRFIIHT